VSAINGRTGTVDDTITVGSAPSGVAVDHGDDTVYVTNNNSSTVSVINGRTRNVDATISVGSNPSGVAVDHGDDTV
jgi:YVTN family beta-propeller protein